MELSPFWGLEDALQKLLGFTKPVAQQVPGVKELGGIDPAYLTALGGGAGMISPQQRIAALMENPEYMNLPIRERLSVFTGQNNPRDPGMQNLLDQYGTRAQSPVGTAPGVKPPTLRDLLNSLGFNIPTEEPALIR